MKTHLFVSLLLLTFLIGCKNQTHEKPKFTIDPNVQLSLNGIGVSPTSVISKIVPFPGPYSVDDVLRYANFFGFRRVGENTTPEAPVFKASRDFEKKRVKVGMAYQVVYIDEQGVGYLGPMVSGTYRDWVLKVAYSSDIPGEWYDVMTETPDGGLPVTKQRDTIAYIPNKVVIEAEQKIKAAFDAGDYEECLRLFKEAYVFTPTTGPQWRALKAKGEQ